MIKDDFKNLGNTLNFIALLNKTNKVRKRTN